MTPMLRDDWWRVAACRNAEAELFFPVSDRPASARSIRQAKMVCESCPVSRQCLRYALENRQEQGIWGGLTETERSALSRRAGKLPAASRSVSDLVPTAS